MDDYYGQQFTGNSFQTNSQPATEKRRGSGLEFNGFNTSDMYGLQELGQNMGHSGKMMGNHATNNGLNGGMKMAMNMNTSMGQPNVMEFDATGPGRGPGGVGSLEGYQFTPSVSAGMMMPAGSMFRNPVAVNTAAASLLNQQRNQQLNLVTQYMSPTSPYGTVMSPTSNYGPSPLQKAQMGMGLSSQYIPQNAPMSMDFSDANLNNLMMGRGGVYNMVPQSHYIPSTMGNNMQQNYVPAVASESPHTSQDSAGGVGHFNVDDKQPDRGDSMKSPIRQNSQSSVHMANAQSNSQQAGFSSDSPQTKREFSGHGSPNPIQSNPAYPPDMQTQQQQEQSEPPNENNQQGWSRHQQPQAFTQRMAMRHQPVNNFKNAYSSTGFDMLTILMRVATRKNPDIAIGAVDLSCAFVVCDACEHDFPIVYCSENFERLTGYTKHEILGRNCRFLQAPDGKVQAGVKRSYVDDDSVLYLKNMVAARKEAQVSIINYRKGGQPFMNLLTMIPISYDSDDIRFFVGFQVDLVEQPNSVTNKNPDGSYTINYQRGLTMPRYVYNGNERPSTPLDTGQTIPRDDVTTVLSTIGTGESELSRRIWDKVLLENTDDVVFVLSLKGLFLYLSPSCHKILEYDANELSGTALSSVCHPSDIVPVTRELKDTSASATVNIVFRIRRKHNGYMWFEGNGSLHTEQGKGRKSIVLVGRERPVYTLSKLEILAAGGIGDNEVWSKLSTSGMFLFVSANVRQLLDKQPEELIGTSIQALMRPDSRQDFMRILEIARSGKRGSSKHELFNKRGQVLQAFSTIYPGDAAEGSKPTFIIAQTRLLKYSRSSSSSVTNQRPQTLPLLDRGSNGSLTLSENSHGSAMTNRTTISRQGSQPYHTQQHSQQHYMSTFEAATTFAGQHGLEIGRQDFALASEENLFDELKTTRSTSWQFELRQMEKRNRLLAEELQGLLAARKKRKRRKGTGALEKDCANCHTRVTPEWRRGPSGNRDLCNSCGLRWAKQQGRISPRTTSQRSVQSANSEKSNASPLGAGAGTREGVHFRPETNASENSRASKAAKTEPATSPRRHSGGGLSNLPTKIEEGEEDEDEESD